MTEHAHVESGREEIGVGAGADGAVRAPACRAILLVEDHPDLRDALQDLLADEGYKVLCARDGRSGLSLLRRQAAPCLVLTDLMMPAMNGWEMIRRIRADAALSKHTVVVLSGALKLAPPPEGIAGIVEKPVQFEELLAVVRTHCGTPPRPSEVAAPPAASLAPPPPLTARQKPARELSGVALLKQLKTPRCKCGRKLAAEDS
jgi:CheY-like chemotaxis protein